MVSRVWRIASVIVILGGCHGTDHVHRELTSCIDHCALALKQLYAGGDLLVFSSHVRSVQVRARTVGPGSGMAEVATAIAGAGDLMLASIEGVRRIRSVLADSTTTREDFFDACDALVVRDGALRSFDDHLRRTLRDAGILPIVDLERFADWVLQSCQPTEALFEKPTG